MPALRRNMRKSQIHSRSLGRTKHSERIVRCALIWLPPEVARQLHMIALEEDTTQQKNARRAENGRHAEAVKLSRILHASCQCCSLDERDAVIDALRPLVEQGWQIDLTYSCVNEPTPRRVTLGARVDVFERARQQQ